MLEAEIKYQRYHAGILTKINTRKMCHLNINAPRSNIFDGLKLRHVKRIGPFIFKLFFHIIA